MEHSWDKVIGLFVCAEHTLYDLLFRPPHLVVANEEAHHIDNICQKKIWRNRYISYDKVPY